MIKSSTQGSEWKKWDLHIHSNASDGNGSPSEIIDTAINKGLSAIAITDHHTVDNLDEIKQIGHEKGVLVISGIEFRTEYGAKSVHIIGLFPDYHNGVKLDAKAIEDFILSPLCLSKTHIISLGRRNKPKENLTDEQAFKEGMFLCQVNFKDAANLIRKYGGIISVHAGSKANSIDEEIKHQGKSTKNVQELYDSLGTLKEELLSEYVDVCEIRKENDSEGFYLAKFGLPSIIASDAHRIDEIGNKFVWIKADLSFEGLKQIIYEPEQRVKIQEFEPDTKENHLVIDSVRFHCSDNSFTNSPIYFNRNLNVIIGGKSSGKSLLLTCIAEVLKGNTDLKAKYDLQDKVKDFDFEVKLVSTELNDKLSNHKGVRNASIIPEIKYISQNELATLADHQIKKISNQLNKLVRGLLREDSDTNLYYENFLQNVKAFDKEREDIINKYFEILETKQALQTNIFELGQKNVIEVTIKEKQDAIKIVTDKIGFVEEEKKQYEEIKLAIDSKQKELEQLKKESLLMINFFSNSENSFKEIHAEKERLVHSTSSNLLEVLKEPLTTLDNILSSFFKINSENEIQKIIDSLFSKINEEIGILNEKLKPFLSKIENQKILEELENALKNQTVKKKEIEKKEKELIDIETKLFETKELLLQSFRSTHTEYTKLIQNFGTRCSLLQDDKLSITGKTFYNFSKFRKAAIQHISGRKNNNWDYTKYPILNDKMSSMSSEDANLDDILLFSLSNLFDAVIAGDYSLNQSTSSKNFLKLIFDDYFYDYWNVEYQGDNLGKMSAGKASFVILMLIVGLSKSKSPLLIDQPEDNLDNRSISTDLVNYIRSKKIERQIILVTHNPNIVVNADAENIIVADQRGQDNNSTCPFQFNYINGAIEHTKPKDASITDTLNSMGIREHITEIVEGGEEAFLKRERKYNFKK